MEALLASLIAVAGTLLGSVFTFAFQRRTSAQAEAFARAQHLRQERLTAYSAYAGAVTALKQATVLLWMRRQEDPDSSEAETRQAFTECDRLGAATENARFRVQLLAEDRSLVALAASAFAAVGPIRSAPTRTALAACEQDLENALDAFIGAAAVQVH
ncbi:hypothetical protein OG756_40080 [Streptomyces sp. NBC_01310]|uniref:hypothetical protein n=1 Tax=Streptomyces sp. NBC_01310 TaxID=2903820 RepID=UPI0035B58743|nr:hypothetical protein OG756_40080 [Streptomyces sp. NBC_01310]